MSECQIGRRGRNAKEEACLYFLNLKKIFTFSGQVVIPKCIDVVVLDILL